MAKQRTTFYCQNCGSNSPKWLGKCPTCGEWNTYLEELVTPADPTVAAPWKTNTGHVRKSVPIAVNQITSEKLDRFSSQNGELDRVLGGGIVNGSLVLIGGEPGIGKSTLMLQVAIQLKGMKILYISGEESLQQIRMRADRIGISGDSCFLMSETDMSSIFEQINGMNPDFVIIDSIQTLHTHQLDATPGSISQVRECTGQLMRFSKETNTPVFLIGHINKEGNIAGPKVLEHMVDTVLQFEGDRHHAYRIMRTIKNRFGSTAELGIYQMREDGLHEVKNPSEMLLSDSTSESPGVAIAASMEGNRPLLIEVQALVSPANYGTAQRSSTGFDLKRLHMLLAVLEKRYGLRLGNQDVFLNITGGIRVDDPSIDLAVCVAVFSSYHDQIISRDHCFIGEIGLGGEIRAVSRLDNRLKEAEKLGFHQVFIAKQKEKFPISNAIKLFESASLKDVISKLFA